MGGVRGCWVLDLSKRVIAGAPLQGEGISKMAQQVRVPTAKPDNLNTISGTHIVEIEKGFLPAALWPPHKCDATPPR